MRKSLVCKWRYRHQRYILRTVRKLSVSFPWAFRELSVAPAALIVHLLSKSPSLVWWHSLAYQSAWPALPYLPASSAWTLPGDFQLWGCALWSSLPVVLALFQIGLDRCRSGPAAVLFGPQPIRSGSHFIQSDSVIELCDHAPGPARIKYNVSYV